MNKNLNPEFEAFIHLVRALDLSRELSHVMRVIYTDLIGLHELHKSIPDWSILAIAIS